MLKTEWIITTPPAASRSSDTPDGDFTYLGCFNPFGYMSRDCTLFEDKDGSAYFISASRDNADLYVYRLTDDYLNADCLVHKLWQGEYRGSPRGNGKSGEILHVFFLLHGLGAQPVPLCLRRQHGGTLEYADGYRRQHHLPYAAGFILPVEKEGRRFIITWRTDGTVKITTIPVM